MMRQYVEPKDSLLFMSPLGGVERSAFTEDSSTFVLSAPNFRPYKTWFHKDIMWFFFVCFLNS